MELSQNAVFEQCHAHFEGRGVDYDFALHWGDVPDRGKDTVKVAKRSRIQRASAGRGVGIRDGSGKSYFKGTLLRAGKTSRVHCR
jgi:hypothetical protein